MQKWPKTLTVWTLPVLIIGLLILGTQSLRAPMPSEQYQQCLHAAQKDRSEKAECKTDETIWQRTISDPVAYYTIWITIFTGVLASVGVIQGYLLFQQIGLARDEFNATHRPKIKVLSLDLDWHTLPDDEGLLDTSRTTLEGFLQFVNEGDAIALVTEIGSKVTLHPEQSLVFNKINRGVITLVNGEEATYKITSDFMSFSSEYGKPTYCVGHVRYEDATGRARKTSFCWRLNVESHKWVRVTDSPYEYAY